jgi:hypothetical protein
MAPAETRPSEERPGHDRIEGPPNFFATKGGAPRTITAPMITQEQVRELFDAVRAQAAFDIDAVCLWGYFFVDRDPKKLKAAGTVLGGLGYRVVELLEPSPEDEDPGLYFLHVEREERHTVETLHLRNLELYGIADELGLESYDGMDVGPARPS